MKNFCLGALMAVFIGALVFVSCGIWGGDITLHPVAFHGFKHGRCMQGGHEIAISNCEVR